MTNHHFHTLGRAMKGYGFETFQVENGNREAFAVCRDIASLKKEPGRPVVLLGPEGSGKSHLLWSMVKEIRASAQRIGLALIMAHEFPDKVRALVQDPGPIQNGKRAILLVDGLEAFRDNAADLEAVVQTFLRHGHHVVLASDVYPDRLLQLTAEFRALLNLGQIIRVHAPLPDPAPEAPMDERVAALRSELEALRQERDTLDKRLAESAVSSTEVESLKALVKSGLEEQERLKEALDQRRGEEETLREEFAQERDALVYDRNALKEEIAQYKKRQSEIEPLREQLLDEARLRNEAAEGRLETAQQQLDTLRAKLREMREEAEAAVAGQRDAATAEIEKLRAENAEKAAASEQQSTELRAELERLRAQLEASREEAENALAEQARLQGVLSAREADDEAAAAQPAPGRDTTNAPEGFEEALARAREESACAEEMLEQARAEQGRIGVELSRAQGRCGAVEFELEKARKQLALQMAEMRSVKKQRPRSPRPIFRRVKWSTASPLWNRPSRWPGKRAAPGPRWAGASRSCSSSPRTSNNSPPSGRGCVISPPRRRKRKRKTPRSPCYSKLSKRCPRTPLRRGPPPGKRKHLDFRMRPVWNPHRMNSWMKRRACWTLSSRPSRKKPKSRKPDPAPIKDSQ